LDRIWSDQPIFFVTTCTSNRRRILDSESIHAICREVWQTSEKLYGWFVGRYVLMPDHAHFFCAPRPDGRSLQMAMGKWKEWTAKYAKRRHQVSMPLWQEEFFDHLLRSGESYESKWEYVRDNPVRAGLVKCASEWRFQGELNKLQMD
jgi:REP element-mobilizing transposase RayT